ncbi:MAG TPA: protein translocase subunit SecD [Trueperaceae bacterium]
MNRRNVTAVVVLAAILLSILYIWQPWVPGQSSLKLGLDLQGGLRVVLQSDQPNPAAEDMQTARSVIENRVNEFGVSEPLIQTAGGDRIVVELPGLSADEQDRALDLIGQQAVLEFRLVEQQANDVPVQMLTLEDLEETRFTGEIIRSARADFSPPGSGVIGPIVLFEIKREYAAEFGEFTAGNIGRRMAVVLDDNIITAPALQSRISDSGQITGIESLDEATDISLVLRSGALPIDLHVEEIRQIGPTLGQDSINAGVTAGIVGAAAVVVLILLYYGPLFGGVLTVGIILAMLFVFGILAGLGAALTLPGIAGLVLTLGAAVDGNVISFERIKEELAAGKSLRLSMKAGFNNSLSAIIDANVTTLLAAAALYQYTTGPVRGFATTLAIGIVASVFVNVVVVPFLLDVLTLRVKRPMLPKGFYAHGIRFVRQAPVVVTVSGLLVLASLGGLFLKGLPLSTDFTGGTSILLRVPDGTTVGDVRAVLDGPELEQVSAEGANIVEVTDPTIEGNLISVRVGVSGSAEASEEVADTLATALQADVLSADFVGPAVGADLRQGALYAVGVALALILVYVAWRFWPNWIVAVASVLAVMHDAALVLGGLQLAGAEFSIPVLAALLFVVGYSLNDSIIIADRIRENLRKVKGKDHEEIVDLSVNQTLSRTVMTSGTTLLPILALFFLGGSVLRDFSLALLIGLFVGTYSSIYIVGWIVAAYRSRRTRTRTVRGAA